MSDTSTLSIATVSEKAVISRVMWRIMPLVTAFYLLAVIDRSNVGFAKLQMVRDLHMTEEAYGLASSLFFVGYVLFEVPSSYAAYRVGARVWFARILGSWGLCTVVMAWTVSGSMFTGLRFLLGVLEAGAYPGIVYCLTLWFPQRYRLQMLGLMTLGSALGNGIGSLIAGPLLDMNGLLGLAGWQWVFIVTGAPALVVMVLLLLYLPDRPEKARFLSTAERSWLLGAVTSSTPGIARTSSPWRVLVDRQMWMFSLAFMLMNTSLYGVIYWLPTVIREFGVTGAQNGALTAAPWLLDAVILLFLPALLRTRRAALLAMVALSVVGVLSFAVSTRLGAPSARYAALLVGTPCISLLFPCFWSLPSRRFAGPHAAVAMAAITSIGNIGGFLAQNLMPWVSTQAGSPVAAMLVPAVCLAGMGIGALVSLSTRDDDGVVTPAAVPV